jgi:hypothetical protein
MNTALNSWASQIGQGHVLAKGGIELYFHAQALDAVDLVIQGIGGQPVVRNAHPEHAAGHGKRLEDGDLETLQGQVPGRGQTGRSRADDGHLLFARLFLLRQVRRIRCPAPNR